MLAYTALIMFGVISGYFFTFYLLALITIVCGLLLALSLKAPGLRGVGGILFAPHLLAFFAPLWVTFVISTTLSLVMPLAQVAFGERNLLSYILR